MTLLDALAAELEAALLRELRAQYALENWQRFAERLIPAVIALADSEAFLGRWAAETRTIELSRSFVLGSPWLEVVSVLTHEMAHQYVDEVARIRDETAHGDAFRRACAERGIDARAAGRPIPASSAAETDRILERIRKLLALAGSPNRHEAEIAMNRAHELMLRHNIDAANANAERRYEVRHVGDPEKRATSVEVEVAGLLAQYFFVEVIRVPVYLPRLGKRGALYELVGTRANVEMASHVYAFLLATCDRLWRENRNDARVKSGRDRLSYQRGVVRGFSEKLRDERHQLRGAGLIWVGDSQLGDFFRARHPRIVRRSHRVRLSDGAHAAGREAGRGVVLHRPVEQSRSSGSPRLLRG